MKPTCKPTAAAVATEVLNFFKTVRSLLFSPRTAFEFVSAVGFGYLIVHCIYQIPSRNNFVNSNKVSYRSQLNSIRDLSVYVMAERNSCCPARGTKDSLSNGFLDSLYAKS